MAKAEKTIKKLTTIHIFGYGETQIIGGETINKKWDSEKIKSLDAFVSYIKSLKPKDKEDKDYHAIHVLMDSRVTFQAAEDRGNPKDNNSFTIEWQDLDLTTLNALIAELSALK